MPFKSEPADLHQRALYPTNVFDLLPQNHDCFLFHDLFQQIDTSEVEAQYSHLGQHAYHPRQLISILIYGYCHGVFSSRQLEKRCQEDLSFMFIAGRNCPNFRVLSDFRKNNAAFFHGCFIQTVALAQELGMASLGHVSLDGSKFKANSSKHKAMSHERMIEKEATLKAEIDELIKQAESRDEQEDVTHGAQRGDELPDELAIKQSRLETIQKAKAALEAREEELNPGKPIKGKKQISFADTDARIMGKKGDFDYRYNSQISVDSDYQVIVGQHVSQNGNDKKEVEPALEAIQSTVGELPETMSLDNGYFSGTNLEALEKVDAHVAVDQGEKNASKPLENSNRRVVKADFEYDEVNDSFQCPEGQILHFRKEKPSGERIYQGEASTCQSCPLRDRCCRSSKGNARTVTSEGHETQRQEMSGKMNTPEAQEVYKQRKVIVEPVFGQIKNGGFRGFSLRGKVKVAGEFSLVCAAHNLKKIVKAAMTGLVRPESGKWVAQGA